MCGRRAAFDIKCSVAVHAVKFGEDGEIYVANGGRSVQVYSREGAYVGRLGRELMGGDDHDGHALGICADGEGRLFESG